MLGVRSARKVIPKYEVNIISTFFKAQRFTTTHIIACGFVLWRYTELCYAVPCTFGYLIH